jgi:glycosyltransferase involved in cell wall biosynthesis
MPKISVLIPVYNTEKFIAQTIESILKQTYQDWELVIVDDCSTDGTYQICEKYAAQEPRIRLHKNEKNLGMMPNWNHGITLCKGDYWGKLDADDWWHEKMLEDCVHILDTIPEVGLVCTKHINIDENGSIIPNSESHPPDFAIERSFDFSELVHLGIGLLRYNVAKQGIGLIRKKIIDQVGNYLLIQPADTEFYFRIGAHCKFYCLNKIYHYHRIWLGSDTRSTIINRIGVHEKNLFEVRKAIFEYYYKHHKITHSQFKKFSQNNKVTYNQFLIGQLLKEKKYLQSLKLFWQNLTISPVNTIKFYFKRIKTKIAD